MPTLTAAIGSALDGRQLVAGRAETLERDDDLALRIAFPPSASSSVGASGVIPTAWNIATAPEDAAAAPERLQSILARLGGEPDDDGHVACPDAQPHDVTDARGCDLVVEQARPGCRPPAGTRRCRAGARRGAGRPPAPVR